jgi:hypothetical protein
MFKSAKSIGRSPFWTIEQLSRKDESGAFATARHPRTRVTEGRPSENPLAAQKP